jgi:hypothetical protein
MFQSKVVSAVLRTLGVVSLLFIGLLSVAVNEASATTHTPSALYQEAIANAGQKKFVVINMSGTNSEGKFRDVWHSNPHSGSLVESVEHPGGTGHVFITVLDRVVYEKIDTGQWSYAGLPAKYKSYENKWFVVRKSSATYKAFLLQEVIYGALLIPINGTVFTIQDNTKLHGENVFGLEGALTGSNPPIPVTLCVSEGKTPLPLEVSVPRTAKNKANTWTATYSFRSSASVIAKPTTSLAFP